MIVAGACTAAIDAYAFIDVRAHLVNASVLPAVSTRAGKLVDAVDAFG